MENKAKKKMGRPKKERTGKHVWIPADMLNTVLLMIKANREQQKQVQDDRLSLATSWQNPQGIN